MRVISGQFRGVRLESAPERELRPMLDRVKEALFNIIRSEVGGSAVLDLFSGSGSLGIEALSRGARSCLFVENNRKLVRLIRRNLDLCSGAAQKARIIDRSVASLPPVPPQGMDAADLVFVDPPYATTSDVHRRTELFGVLEGIRGPWIGPGALLILHHEPAPHLLWPTEVFECFDRRIYGRSQLSFFQTAPSPPGP